MTRINKGTLPGFSIVDHVGLTVPDMNAAVRFYCDVFGCVELFRMGPFDSQLLPSMPDGRDWSQAHVNVADATFSFVMLQLGPNLMLELFQYDRPGNRRIRLPRNCDLGSHHLALKVDNLDKAIEYLKQQPGVTMLEGPIVVSDGPCAGMGVIYFLDPWGNQMELVEFNR